MADSPTSPAAKGVTMAAAARRTIEVNEKNTLAPTSFSRNTQLSIARTARTRTAAHESGGP